MNPFKEYLSNLPKYPLVEAASAAYESLSEPTMYLRKAYKKPKSIEKDGSPHTEKFNAVWHEKHPYESALDALDTLFENPSLVVEIVTDIAAFDPDGIASTYKDYDAYDFVAEDIYTIVNSYPQTACKVIYSSDEYTNQDRTTLDFNHTVVNGWLVHNSNYAWDIWREGFQYGDEIGSLAYSNAGSTAGKEYGDYLFAFPIDEAPRPHFGRLKYGSGSIVFIGTGNEFYHYGDEENQVIFDRRQPKSCFIVDRESESSEYNVYGENEYRPLYHGDYEDCLKWIQKNGNDYRGQMRSWGKNVDPKRSVAVNKQWK